jgi:hypothetical protein
MIRAIERRILREGKYKKERTDNRDVIPRNEDTLLSFIVRFADTGLNLLQVQGGT